MNEYIVDIQGFTQSPNQFILKELAILPINSNSPTTFLFEPPCAYEKLLSEEVKTVRWLEANYHAIPWKSGYIPYSLWRITLRDQLQSATRIYCKGHMKKIFISQALPGKLICNIEDLRCPPLKNLQNVTNISCYYHMKQNSVCAIKNVYKIRNYLLTRLNINAYTNDYGVDEVDKSEDTKLSADELAERNEKIRSMYT